MNFDELVSDQNLIIGCNVATVETPGGSVKLASCSSEGILDWFDENESDVPAVRQYRGLRLVVRCIVNDDGMRVVNSKDQVPDAVAKMKRRGSKANAPLIAAAFEVNGMTLVKPDKPTVPEKNDPSEAPTSAASLTPLADTLA